MRRGIAALGLALAVIAAPAAEAGLKAPGNVRVTKAGVSSVSVAWKDRARGERRYEVRVSGQGGRVVRVRAGRERAKVRKLSRGTRYRIAVAACRKRRCKSRAGKDAATLLAPFNGPHPALQCAVFPPGDDFNADISDRPLAARSAQIIAGLSGDLHPDFGSSRSYGIPYTVVPARQPGARVRFAAYGDESDSGPYPIPPGAPVEGGRRADGDRHVLVVRRPAQPGGACRLYELYRSFAKGGAGNLWTGDSGAVFDLGAPLTGQRPGGWTSADAAGLPIFPGLVTYEEVRSGVIDHAIRITFSRTRRAYYPPATHYASDSCSPDLPAMGERLRLRAGYDISGIGGDARVIAVALKKYGAIVADNGSDFFISGSTDRRWDDDDLNQLKRIPGSAFEVVKPSGPAAGPC